jgi:Ran GTPase-activating protein (RanGAP) involved in mRNA processing and transport
LTQVDLRETTIENEGKQLIAAAVARSSIQYLLCDEYALTEGIQTLDVSGAGLSPITGMILCGALRNNTNLTELDLSSNDIGSPVYPKGWTYQPEAAYKEKYFHSDGRRQMEEPEGTKPGGSFTLADSIHHHALVKLNIKGNNIEDEGKTAIGLSVRDSGTIKFLECDEWAVLEDTTTLDVSHKKLLKADAILLAGVLHNNTTVEIVNVLGNNIGSEQAYTLIGLMVSRDHLVSLCGLRKDAESADFSGVGLKPTDALLIAADIPSKESMTQLTFGKDKNARDVLSMNVADVEADFSLKGLKPSGAIILASMLPKYPALSKVTFGGDFGEPGVKKIPGAVTLDTSMTSADLSGKMFGSAGAIILARFIPKWVIDNRAELSELDLSRNNITASGAEALANGLKVYKPLTKLNMRGNKLTLGHKRGGFDGTLDWHYENNMKGVVALANAIIKARGLTELDISNNAIGAAGAKAFSKTTLLLKKLDISCSNLGGWPDKSGLKALGNCIAVSTSLQDLDVSSNDLRGEDAAVLAVGFGSNGSMKTLNIAENPVREEGGEAMIKALEMNTALASLNLSDHRMPPHVQRQLREVCSTKAVELKCGFGEDFHTTTAEKNESREARIVRKIR